MNTPYTVTLLGHRSILNTTELEHVLLHYITEIVRIHDNPVFLIGRNGNFDLLASSVIRRVQNKLGRDRCCHTLVLPYPTQELRENETSFQSYYDDVEINSAAQSVHFKSAIVCRNHNMIDRSDLLLCYVTEHAGGAYQAMEYARKHHVPTINLASNLYQNEI